MFTEKDYIMKNVCKKFINPILSCLKLKLAILCIELALSVERCSLNQDLND